MLTKCSFRYAAVASVAHRLPAPAVTERLTLLVLPPAATPTLLVPALEAPDAERRPARPALTSWTGRTARTPTSGRALRRDGRFGISDTAWAMHLLGLQKTLPETRYVP